MKISANQIDSYIKNIEQQKIAGALVFGPDQSVAMSRFNAIAKKIVADLQDQFLVVNLSKDRLSHEPSVLSDEFYSFSMFGGRKLILVRETDAAFNSALKDLMKSPDEVKKSDNFILILAGDLDKSNALRKICENEECFAALACYEDSDLVLKKLIEQQLKKNGVEAAPELALHLFEILPKNRQIIAAEIEKLAIYLDGDELSLEKIDETIINQGEAQFDEFVDAFISGQKKSATKILEKLFKSGFDGIMAARFLSNYLQKLQNARSAIELRNQGFEQAVAEQKLFFKAQNSFKKHLRATKLAQLNSWLEKVWGLEKDLKTKSFISSRAMFVFFIESAAFL